MEVIQTATFGSVLALVLHGVFIRHYGSRISISLQRLVLFELVLWLGSAIVVVFYTIEIGFTFQKLFERLSIAVVFSMTFGLLALSLVYSESQGRLTAIAMKVLTAKAIPLASARDGHNGEESIAGGQ